MSQAETSRSFIFASVGGSYSAAIMQDDPIIGKKVTGADVVLKVRSAEGSDAAKFRTELDLPIVSQTGSTSYSFVGASAGWSGEGDFEHAESTDRFNGAVFRTGRYAGQTVGDGFSGEVLEGSFIRLTYQP